MKIANSEWKKRLTAGVLAIAMLCGIMPPAVMADDTTNLPAGEEDVLLIEETPDSENTNKEPTTALPQENAEEAEEAEDAEEAEEAGEADGEQEPLLNSPMLLMDDPAVDGEDLPATQEGEPTPQPIPTTPTLTLENSGLTVSEKSEITIRKPDELIKLSNVLPKDYYNKTILLSMTEGESWNLGVNTSDGYTFLGLGGKENGDYPFSGILNSTLGEFSILTTHPLFNYLSTSAVIGKLQLGSHASTSEEDPPITSTAPLLAGIVSGTATGEWSVKLVGDSSFGGLIGTLESGSVNLTISGDAGLTCSSDAHTGLFCNTMRAGTTLTAVNNATGITVNATGTTTNAKGITVSCDAGGFVGRMEDGATLTASGNSVASVTSEQGNAGGIVGSAVNANITVSGTGSGNITVSASKNAGGIVGDYVNSEPNAVLDLSNYTTSVTISGGSNAGGVFGALTNNTGTDSAASAYTIRNGSVTITATGSVTNFGGLIGSYGADAMENTLNTTGVTVTATNNGSAASYGGIIGSVSDNSYVEIENLGTVTTAGGAVTNFGGLVGVLGDNSGAFLNIGSVTLVRGSNPSATTAVGGLVGALNAGVVRLHGTTDLSGMTFTGAGGGTGQIVGKNTNGLVYAVGTGNTGNAGWLLKRPTGATASDIGNWGQVVRLDGERLTEKNDNNTAPNTDLFAFNETNHTVTVLGGDSTITRITSARDFASYALHYDFGCAEQAALKFSVPNVDQNVTISGKIDLTGTGILGIGRDNGTGADGTGSADSNYFTGTISGTGDTPPTIVLDIGCSAFGDGVDKSADPIGNGGLQLFSDGHNFLGLLPVAGGSTTIRNLTIAGAVMGNSGSGAKGRVAGAIGYCKADEITFNNVTVSADVTVKGSSSTIYQGGFFGDMVNGNNKSVTFQGSTWSGTLDNSVSGSQIGGFAAYIQNGKKTITVADCTLSGTIKTSADGDAHVGGLFADFQDGGGNTTVTISDLKVTGTMKVEAPKATSCGGFLGYSWPKTNVTFAGTGASGITVSGATLNAPKARFGGLVYQASGYWNATAANSIKFTSATAEDGTVTKTQISGKSDASNPSGLLVGTGLLGQNNALYLEVGTWRKPDAADSDVFAYDIGAGAVQLNLGTSTTFDELVGVTIDDNKGHNNAVVSLATPGHDEIDNTACNTYTGQIENFQNGKTRYYYNLDNYRSGVAANNLTSPGAVLCWSVSQYAASNIRDYFCSGSGGQAIITSTTGLTGYSYYPVSPLSSVSIKGASLTFAKADITTAEGSNKTPDDPNHQHYMMHYGLLYDVSNPVSVSGSSSFSGTVGMDTEGSGALIFGTVTGNTNKPVEISLQGIKLNGLRVSGVDGNTTYAPLLINKNTNGGMKLTVDNLGTGAGYSADIHAATSLIGKIGGPDATKLALYFSNIALDGRTRAGYETINNNGDSNHPISYHTTKSIFTRAILLESFQYREGSTGVYNFNSFDTMVSFGKEISDSQRNPGEQHLYYDNEDPAWDGEATKDADNANYDYSGYLPYVFCSESVAEDTNNYHELDVNLRPVNLDVGCGTYGHPYEIKDGKQLVTLAKFLSTGTANNWVVRVDKTVYDDQKQSAVHTGENATHKYYRCVGSTWSEVEPDTEGKYAIVEVSTSTVNPEGMKAYLRNAYYEITKDIDITSNEYVGIGTAKTDEAFSGVIVGKVQTDGGYPMVKITSTVTTPNYGGLIGYSQGSVIKNLNVDYSGAKITVSNDAVPGTYTGDTLNNPFFGGVVGYCMGGDTIIDKVSVTYGDSSVSLSGDKPFLIAAGGYVGLVGGAKDKSGYEKTGGGVVFRNMGNCTNNFADYQIKAQDGSGYFYCNPYVGRVLDGYACAESCTVNNTDKNYKIPTLDSQKTGLSVSDTTVTVSSEQGLWLLSAIVNSGAGAMDSTGKYTDTNGVVDAYQYGKPRSGDYGSIGSTSADIADEAHWGGVESGTTAGEYTTRVSYLVKEYTGGTNAAQIAGGTTTSNIAVTIEFTGDAIDMSSYGNGFRGIGASYGFSVHNSIYYDSDSSYKNVMRRSIYASAVNGNNSTIKLAMSQKLYHSEAGEQKKETLSWPNQGAGLFVNFGLPTKECTVSDLTINGIVEMKYCMDDGSTADVADSIFGESCAGGFAAKILYSNNGYALTFNGLHLGGDSEETKLTVSGAAAVGGALGSVAPSKTSVVFTNTTAQNITVSTHISSAGNAGGLVGYFAPRDRDSGSCTVNTKAGSSKFENITITITGDASGWVAAGGLIAKCEQKQFTIQDCEIANVTVNVSRSKQCGGLVGCAGGGGTIQDVIVSGMTVTVGNGTEGTGGLVGETQKNNTTLTIKNVTLGKMDAPVYVWNKNNSNTGGMVGYLNGAKTASIQNCAAQYLYVLGNSACGGLVGKHNYTSLSVSNVSLSNTTVATKRTDNAAGLVVGEASSDKITTNGYNILVDSCKVGCNTSSQLQVFDLPNSNLSLSMGTNKALWVGNNKNSTATFVAVAVKGNISPAKDIGVNPGTASIVYADYPVVQTITEGFDSPYLDVNPSETLAGKTCTGNGVGYLDGGNTTLQNSIPYKILSEAKTDAGHYYNVKDSAGFKFSDIVSTDNNNVNSQKNIRLRTFAEYLKLEENQPLTDELREAGNFPLLVVDNLGGSKVTDAIWNYIAALTNVPSGADAKKQTASVTPTTYHWDGVKFTRAQNSTLTGSGTGFVCSSNAYDNGKMQFTLLDVKYDDPTGVKKDGFHLYVPVLVKKIMDAKVTVSLLAGTNYYSGAYGNTPYATAGFEEPVTAYITYNYNRMKEEWQDALNDGSNLLWYYEKTLNLTGGDDLPVGTKLTLVNAQSGQMYYHKIEAAEVASSTQTAYKLEAHFTNSSSQPFVSSPVCDLLGITATEAPETSPNRYVVVEPDSSKATVRIGSTYYRPYKTEDGECESYCLTVGEDTVGSDGYLTNPEGYYLTIQIPKMDEPVNNTLFIENDQALTQSDNALPARVVENLNSGNTSKHYVIYDGLNTPTISTVIRHYNKNGEEMNSPEMQNGDSIEVQLTSTISLTEDGVTYYNSGFAPADLYHQFLLSLRKMDENGVSASLIGAEEIQWTYTIGNEVVGSGTEYPRDLDVLALTFGTDRTDMIKKLKTDSGHSVTVEATITLRYGNNVSAVFPERGTNDETSGLYVHAESRAAADSNLLPTTGVKAKVDETNGFYCASPSSATMSYNAIEKYGSDGKTLQLGINPLDRYSIGIRAEGTYDYSAVSETTLANATKIRYTLELFRKGEDGRYPDDPVKGISYLPAPTLVTNLSGGSETFQPVGNSYQLEHSFVRADSGNEIIIMDLEPKTGRDLEALLGFYANYRVRLTAVMLDAEGNQLSDTQASDYIVYTNAKILQNLVSDPQ